MPLNYQNNSIKFCQEKVCIATGLASLASRNYQATLVQRYIQVAARSIAIQYSVRAFEC